MDYYPCTIINTPDDPKSEVKYVSVCEDVVALLSKCEVGVNVTVVRLVVGVDAGGRIDVIVGVADVVEGIAAGSGTSVIQSA